MFDLTLVRHILTRTRNRERNKPLTRHCVIRGKVLSACQDSRYDNFMTLAKGKRDLSRQITFRARILQVLGILIAVLVSQAIQAQSYNVSTLASYIGIGSKDGTNSVARFNFPMDNYIAGQAGVSGLIDGTNQHALSSNPYGITADKNGDLYVADVPIRKLIPDATGTNWVVTTIRPKSDGSYNPFFYNATGVAVDNAGNLYFVQPGSSDVTEFSPDGTNWLASRIDGDFYAPFGMCMDSAGNLYVADTGNGAPASSHWRSHPILKSALIDGNKSKVL